MQAGSPRNPGDAALPTASDPLLRLSRLLEAAREAADAEVLAVADATGCLVAGAGAWADCEELAALAPLLRGPLEPDASPTGPANDTLPDRFDVMSRRREVRRLCIDGLEVLLCGEGEPHARRGALERAADVCRVALGRRLPGGR